MTGDQVKRVTVEEAKRMLLWWRGREISDTRSFTLDVEHFEAAVREDERERMGYMIRHTTTGEPD